MKFVSFRSRCAWLFLVTPFGCADSGAIVGATESADTSGSSSDGGANATAAATTDGDTGTTGEPTGASTTCGDGTLDADEVCDGDLLGGASCESQGYGPGTLGCAQDCMAFDTTQCGASTNCHNGTLDPGEDCDQDRLGIGTCEALGFAGGDLSCGADCRYDTTMCVPLSCGNGRIDDANEDCDGDSFGRAGCTSLGYGAGELACTENCRFDTSACCGDGVAGTAEVCDGADVGTDTCEDHGFEGGTLTCNGTCDGVSTAQCFTCGDEMISGSEQCEGDNLGRNDCTTVAGNFGGGVLACNQSCQFDVSGCSLCQNGMIDGDEQCDGVALGGDSCLDHGLTGGELACTASCTYDLAACTSFSVPGPGDLVITEVMQNPGVLLDSAGEWFEIHNVSASETFQLRGCRVDDVAGVESFDIDVDLAVAPGEFVTFAVSANPGFAPDFVWPDGFVLNNGSDSVRLLCGSVTVDRVSYDGGAIFPDPTGASMQLDINNFDAAANDDGRRWCEGTADLGNGDLGTPGQINGSCFSSAYDIDACRLQDPVTINEFAGAAVDVSGRVLISGVTDQTAGVDAAASLFAAVGYGPDGTDPALSDAWVWTTADANRAWVGSGADALWDEYVGQLIVPSAGTYDFAYRFTGDAGVSYTYCDAGTGSTDGYSPVDGGTMVSMAGGDGTALYFSEVHEGASTYKAVEIYNPGPTPVDLSQCRIDQYFNGNAMVGSSLSLEGMLAATEVQVLCSSSVVSGQCDQVLNLQFNGDDAIALVCGGQPVDVFGQIGFDPGVEWNSGGVGTADQDLRRLCSVSVGDSEGSDTFDPSAQWESFALVAGVNYDDLGTYNCP